MKDQLTPALVVICNNGRDWRRMVDEGWYRIPLDRAPWPVAAEYLAFYQTRRSGLAPWQIEWYAAVRRCMVVPRRVLLPDVPDHPRADHLYYRVELSRLQRLPRPVPSRALRRITFIPTTLEQLFDADDVRDLWVDDAAAALWRQFPDAAVKATRALRIEEQPGVYVSRGCSEAATPCKRRRPPIGRTSLAPYALLGKALLPSARSRTSGYARMMPEI